MAKNMADSHKVYNKLETLFKHIVIYLRGKYNLKYKSMARFLALRIINKDPLNFNEKPIWLSKSLNSISMKNRFDCRNPWGPLNFHEKPI